MLFRSDRTQCYHIDTVVIPSNRITINIAGTPVQSSPESTAGLGFNPNQWISQWSSSSNLSIDATISNISGGHYVDEVEESSILLGGIVFPLSVIRDDTNQTLTVRFDAADAVKSLGSLPPSVNYEPFTVYPKIQFLIENELFTSQAPVTVIANPNTGTLIVQADKHIVGSGPKPPVNKIPIAGMETRVYDKRQGSCAASKGISWQNYPAIWSGCETVATGTTNTSLGQVTFILNPGNYLVIGTYTAVDPDIYPGVSVGSITAGSIVTKYLQVIQNAQNNLVPAKYTKLTGSELLIIEPEYIEWDSTQELYPFVFSSVGDWGVTTAVSPPEGFVTDYKNLATDVTNTEKALQFTITDIGSKWVPTGVNFTIKHKGKTTKIADKIGIKLAPHLAKQKGISVFGE